VVPGHVGRFRLLEISRTHERVPGGAFARNDRLVTVLMVGKSREGISYDEYYYTGDGVTRST
jgi:hypothetical protein